jgi:hypothetical protein
MKKSIIALTILASAISTQASIILSDTFSYPDGGLIANSAGIWIAHSAAGSNPLQVTNGQARVVGASGSWEDVSANMAGGPYATNSGVTLYSSYTLIISNNAGLPGVAGGYISHFKDAFVSSSQSGFSFHGRVFLSATNTTYGSNAASGTYLIGIGNGSLANTASGQLTNILVPGEVYTVVTRCELGNNQSSTIWVNPSSESDYSATAIDYNDPTNQAAMAAYAFRQNNGGGTVYIDNLRIGTSFADVAGANTAPTISSVPTQSIPANGSTGPLGFTVADAESTADSLIVTASSSNTGLVPNNPANLVVGGSGANRTLTVIPAPNQEGSTTVTVNVSDGVNTSFTTFVLQVGFPTISAIPSQITATNTPTPAIPFVIGDAESPASSLNLTATSSNPGLVTVGDIVFGGSASNRTVTITPEPDQTGVSTITVFVDDGQNTNSAHFTVTVRPLLGVLFSDSFSYPDGPLYLATGSTWQHASPTGTNFFEVLVTNGMAELSRSLNEDVGNDLSGGPYPPSNAVVFYTGFQFMFTALPSANGEYFLHLKDSATGSNFRCKFFVQTTNAAFGAFRMGILNSASSGPFQFPRDLYLNHPYIAVARYNSGAGESRLWINPTSESSRSVDALDNPITSTIGGIGLREESGIGTNLVDNLIVSTSFADVVPVVVSEPLQVESSGGNLTLTWTNALLSLQTSTNVQGPYVDVAGAASPYTTSLSGDQQYFRLKY